jgi:hypothetical protein
LKETNDVPLALSPLPWRLFISRDETELCTYSVSPVIRSLEMDHAIETGVRSVVALIAMGIEFFLRKNVSASLDSHEYFAIAHGGSLRSGA